MLLHAYCLLLPNPPKRRLPQRSIVPIRADSKPNQHADSEGNYRSEQGPLFRLVSKTVEGVIARPRASPNRFGAEACGFTKRCPLAAAQAIHNISQDWTDCIYDLPCGGSGSRGCTPSRDLADGSQLAFNCAEMIGNG